MSHTHNNTGTDTREHRALCAVEAFNGWEIRFEGEQYKQCDPIASHINHGPDGGEAIAKALVERYNSFLK